MQTQSLNPPSTPQIKPFSRMSHAAAPHVESHLNSIITNNITTTSKKDDSRPLRRSFLGIHAEYSSTAEKTAKKPLPKQLRKRQKNKRMKVGAKVLPSEKIASCQRHIAPEYDYAVVHVNPLDSSTHFRGLVCCDSYSCPHCAIKRSEQDRHELTVALAEAEKMGWYPFMVTFTCRHNAHDRLTDVQESLAKAYNRFFSGSWWVKAQAKYLIKAKVKIWETTFGDNGWHPHTHPLLWTELEVTDFGLRQLRKEFEDRWLEMLDQQGASALREYGIHIETASSKVAEYLAKWGYEPEIDSWGIESELTKAQFKKAGHDGMTPFELLGAAAGETDQLERLQRIFPALDREALMDRGGQLYKEYFLAFKGKPRLHWGRTKELLHLDEALKKAEEVEAERQRPLDPDDEVYPMVMIPRGDEWVKVSGGYKNPDKFCELEEVCSTGNPYEVQRWLKQHDIQGIIPDIAWERFNRLKGRAWQSPGDDWQLVAGGRVE